MIYFCILYQIIVTSIKFKIMEKVILSFVFLVGFLVSFPLIAQTEKELVALGLPGDNLNLYAVLDVFQKSKTVAEFEMKINSKESNINNLDLNNDDAIDYIRVLSYKAGDSHNIVLRVAINNTEYQDVAVIEVNKNRNGNVIVQIIGDEELYGKDYILEPSGEYLQTVDSNYWRNETEYTDNYWNDVFYVNNWPIIMHLYAPSFVIFVSPWYWNFYPPYWRSWHPVFYQQYWGFHRHYYKNHFYRRVGYIRYPQAYSNYGSRRNTAPTVLKNRVNNAYKKTYEGRIYEKPLGTVLPRYKVISGAKSGKPARILEMRSAAPSTRERMQQNSERSPSGTQSARHKRPLNRQPAPHSNSPTRTGGKN